MKGLGLPLRGLGLPMRDHGLSLRAAVYAWGPDPPIGVYSHLLSVPLQYYSGNGLLLDWLYGSLFPEGITIFVNSSLPCALSLKVPPLVLSS